MAQPSVAGASSWKLKNRKAYGISMSLYDQHPVSGKISGMSRLLTLHVKYSRLLAVYICLFLRTPTPIHVSLKKISSVIYFCHVKLDLSVEALYKSNSAMWPS